jgi:hypothetical protein
MSAKMFCILVWMIIFILSGCTMQNQVINETPVGNENIATVVTPTSFDNNDEDIENLRNTITASVNDDVWYRGSDSEFYHFISMTTVMEVYSNPKDVNHLRILFTDKVKNWFGIEGYITATYWYDTKCIYVNEPSFLYYYETLEEARDELKISGHIYNSSTNISFCDPEKPQYPELNTEKEKKITDIEQAIITEIIEFSEFEKGEYRLYIRDFRYNNHITYVVVETKNGEKKGIYTILLYENGNVATFGSPEEVTGTKTELYFIEQIKQTAFERDIKIE